MIVFKVRRFAKWQMLENLSDTVLCEAVKEMQAGLNDACLGGLLYKKRVASLGSGKRGGYRTMLSARIGSHYVFLYGFAKNEKSNITAAEQRALQLAGKAILGMTCDATNEALRAGLLMEVCCDQQDH